MNLRMFILVSNPRAYLQKTFFLLLALLINKYMT